MAASDAKPIPQKNVAYRVTFPILDADGDLVSGAATLDSEISKDGGTFADCTNEATEIATNSGMYFLDLTATEMNADTVAIIVKTSTAGAKTTPIVMYPEEAGDIRVNLTQWLGVAPLALVSQRVSTSVGAMASGVLTAAAIATDAITAAKIAANAITSAKIATDAIGSAQFAQAAADKVWSSATRTLTAFSTALALSVWDVLESAIVTASSIGLKVKNNLDAAVTTRATPAQVNTEVLDVLNVDTITLPGQEAPPATPTHRQAIAWLYKVFRNRKRQTATTWELMDDAETTVDAKATVSDDGTTAIKQEVVTGP